MSMPPHMGKWIKTRVAVTAMIITPIHLKPSRVVMLVPVKNRAWVTALPALPAAGGAGADRQGKGQDLGGVVGGGASR